MNIFFFLLSLIHHLCLGQRVKTQHIFHISYLNIPGRLECVVHLINLAQVFKLTCVKCFTYSNKAELRKLPLPTEMINATSQWIATDGVTVVGTLYYSKPQEFYTALSFSQLFY